MADFVQEDTFLHFVEDVGKYFAKKADLIAEISKIIENKPAENTLIVSTNHDENGGISSSHTSDEIITHVSNGGNTILKDVDVGILNFMYAEDDSVLYGANIVADDGAMIFVCMIIRGTTVTSSMSLFNPSEYAKVDDVYTKTELGGAFVAVSEELSNRYTKTEIDAIMGSYIEDIYALVGG